MSRTKLGDWFVEHGKPLLLLDPIPKYVGEVNDDPYADPENPPDDPATRGVTKFWNVEGPDLFKYLNAKK